MTIQTELNCKLCNKYKEKSLMENDSCIAFYAENPVNFGHIIISVKNNKSDFFDLSYKEYRDMDMMIKNCKSYIDKNLSPDGYNLGYNIGRWAGQEYNHCHAHLIPRYAGDIPATELNGGITNLKRKARKSD